MELSLGTHFSTATIFSNLIKIYKDENINTADGLKIDFKDGWVHLRESNTEPIIRIYSESHSEEMANTLTSKVMSQVNKII